MRAPLTETYVANFMFLLFGDNDDHGGDDRDNDDDGENADDAAAAADGDDDTAKCRTELKVSTCQTRWPPFTDSPYFTCSTGCTNRKILRGVFVFNCTNLLIQLFINF